MAFYYIFSIASLNSHDLAQHEALGIDMLYTSGIGPQSPTHTELMEFVTGFRLPCSNGFNFGQVLCSDPSGSAGFISKTWTSVIHNFGSIEPYLIMFTPSRPRGPLLCQIGQGKNKIQQTIEVDSPAFRPNCFCWSVTESPHIDFDEHQKLAVHFVRPDDEDYHSDEATRRSLMKQGVITFRARY
ncbi:hypothetical protein K438DRAFT_1775107 [Mycena galopus ATCC 62051]|nr:hypothetical protein K438DRAFT_1775107 [Mycena galopus ATCC 62051]